MSMRSKITAAFAMCISLPMAAGMGALWLGTEDTLRQQSYDDMQSQTRSIISAIEYELAGNLSHLKAWSTMPMMQEVLIGDEGKELARALSDLNLSYRDFNSLTITNAQGNVIATTDPAMRNTNLSNIEGVHAAVSGRITQSGFTKLREGASESIQFTVPLMASYDRQTVIGTLTGVVDFNALAKRVLQHSPLNIERRVFALAQRGANRIVYANRTQENLQDDITGIDIDKKNTKLEINILGETSLVAFAKSTGRALGKDPGLVAFGITPVSAVYAAADKVSNIFVAVAGLAAVLALFIAWQWATPLVQLSSNIGRLAYGDHRIFAPEIPKHSTFAPLVRALETMKEVKANRDRLAARELELVQANDKTLSELREKERKLRDLGHALSGHMADVVSLCDLISRENLTATAARRPTVHLQELNDAATQLLSVIQAAVSLTEQHERSKQGPSTSDSPSLQRLSA